MSIRIDDALSIGIRILVFLVLLMPLAVTGTFPFPGDDTLFPFIVGKAIYARFLIELAFGAWLILAMRNASYRPPRSWVLWLFGAWVVASLISAVAGVSFQRSFWGDYRRMAGVFDLMHWLGYLIVLISVFKSRREWNCLLNATLAVAIIVSLLGLVQHFEIRMFPSYLWYLQSTDRIDSTFGNPTFVGVYLMVTTLVALGLLARSFEQPPKATLDVRRMARPARRKPTASAGGGQGRRWTWRVFWLTAAVLGLWVMTLSGSRGSTMGLVVAFLFVGAGYAAWGHRKGWRYLAGASVTGLIVLMLTVPVVRGTALFQRLTELNVLVARFDRSFEIGFGESFHDRYISARVGIEAFLHAPVMGWGPENFAVAFDRYVDGRDLVSRTVLADQAHNKLIEELTTKGLIGITAYLLLIGWLGWAVVRAVRSEPHERLFVLFVGAAFMGYVVQNLMLFDTPAAFLLFVLLAGWVGSREAQLQAAAVTPVDSEGNSGAPGRAGKSDAGEREEPSRLRRWLQRNSIRPELMVNAATVLVALITLASIYLYTYRPYRAAQMFPLRGTSIESFFTQAQESFTTFPPLATLGRQVMFDTLARNWGVVTPESEAALLNRVRSEGRIAVRSEPQNARLHISLARIYQAAGEDNMDVLQLARPHVAAALRLAPELFQTIKLEISQDIAEENYDVALTKVLSHPEGERFRRWIQVERLEHVTRLNLRRQLGDHLYECRWASANEGMTLERRAELDCEQATEPG